MNVGVSFVHTSVIDFFGLGGIYFFYIIYKISNSIINAKKANRLDLDYERCSNFGDIISNTYTLLNYIAWQIVSFVIMTSAMRLFAFEASIFIVIILINLIVSIVFIAICAKGTTKETKMKKENVKE